MEARHLEFPQPAIILRGNFMHPRDAFLVVERHLLCKIALEEVPFALLSAFYTFNMEYTYSCNNFYSFLEYFFLGCNIPKRSKLQHFITSITNIIL